MRLHRVTAQEDDHSERVPPTAGAASGRGVSRSVGAWTVLLLLLYSAGLTRDLSAPWVGMHDWNGAFFSQLARNFLRYPVSVHHGMPIVAAGESVPPVEERSIYATHPPGLVWLVAVVFKVFGESEAVARLVPILASLGALALLIWLVSRAYGSATAILAGLIYAAMPMSVYFGRMVDHEAICLAAMLAAVAAWCVLTDRTVKRRTRAAALAGWMAAVSVGVWVDWSAVLFVGLFCGYVIMLVARGLVARRLAALLVVFVGEVTVGMICFIVYAGLDGAWGDFVPIFLSRSTEKARLLEQGHMGSAWGHTLGNLTWPVVILSLCGLVISLGNWDRRRRKPTVRQHQSLQRDRRIPSGASAARDGLGLVLLTGILWVAVFWRQYQVHNYWLFYMGPAAAVFSARALLWSWRRLSLIGSLPAHGCVAAVLLVTLGLELRGASAYFDRTSAELALRIEDWKQVRGMTSPGDRVVLYHDPFKTEERGGYRFRNLVPPQLAYYLDRPMAVESDFAKVAENRDRGVVFVLSKANAVIHGEALRALRVRFREIPLAREVVFDLRGRPAE